MALDFPASPSDGQVFTSGTRAWVYDSTQTKWVAISSDTEVALLTSLMRRNAILNGAMSVSQRGTTFTSASSFNNNDDSYTLDRWILLSDGNDVVDVSQDTADVPTGGLYAAKLEVETISKKFGFCQIIEQKNCIGLIGDTVTLSFKAKVNNAGAGRLDNIKAVILSWDGTADTVTSDVVSAWGAEDTTPTWATNWTAENTPSNLNVTTSWADYSLSAAIDTASTKNIAVFIWADGLSGTLSDTLHITDVQLEVGSRATAFERRPMGEEVALCQRYYQKSYDLTVAPGTVTDTGRVDYRVVVTDTYSLSYNFFKVTMRSTPTVAIYSNATGTAGKIAVDIPSSDVNAFVDKPSQNGFVAVVDNTSVSAVATIGWHYTASSEL